MTLPKAMLFRSDCPGLICCWHQATCEWSWRFKIANTWSNSRYSYLFEDFLSPGSIQAWMYSTTWLYLLRLETKDEWWIYLHCVLLLYIVICSHIELLCPLICNSAQVKNRNALRCVWVWSRTGWSLQQQRLSFLMKSVWTWLCMNMYEHLVYPRLAIVRKSWTTNNHWILGYLLFRQSHMFGKKNGGWTMRILSWASPGFRNIADQLRSIFRWGSQLYQRAATSQEPMNDG